MYERDTTYQDSPPSLALGGYPPLTCWEPSLKHFVMNTFASFQDFADFTADKRASIALTSNGSQVLLLNGSVAATIKNELKGSTIQETAQRLRSVNLTVGIPHSGSTDMKGRPSLPCIIESKSDWETIDL